MSPQTAAYVAYASGSVVFVVVAVMRGSALLALGSGLFLLGTLLLLVPKVTSATRGRREARRVRWETPPRGGAAR